MQDVNPIRILVVDDHFMVRLGLSASLDAEPDMMVIAEVNDGEGALAAYREHSPNVVIMDLRLHEMNGVDATAALLREFPEARVLMLSTYRGEEGIYRSLRAGARGFVLKTVQREELLRAIRMVHSGGHYVDSVAAQCLAERTGHSELTARELEVLKLLVKGMSNKEIAQNLSVAEVTIKLHVTHVLEKMGASDRTQAATLAIQRGVVFDSTF
jgi:DNA-binding NarL/FixJ family response regulator